MGLIKRAVTWGMLLAVMAVCSPSEQAAAGPRMPRSAECTLAPIGKPVAGEPLILELTATPTDSCEEMIIIVRRQLDAGFTGDTSWAVPAVVDQTHTERIRIVVADTGLSGIDMGVQCGRIVNVISAYFWPDADSVIQFAGRPSQEKLDHWYRRPKPIRVKDTLSEEGWKTEYEVFLMPKDSADQAQIEKIIQRRLRPEDRVPDGRYRIKLSLRVIAKLGALGFERAIRFVEPPPWDPQRPRSSKVGQDPCGLDA